MDPIRTISGKTARDRLRALRERRLPAPPDHTEMLVDKLDALAKQAYTTIQTVRDQMNALRLLAVDARQTVKEIRKTPDIEI
jgi:uncharacterized membrane protein